MSLQEHIPWCIKRTLRVWWNRLNDGIIKRNWCYACSTNYCNFIHHFQLAKLPCMPNFCTLCNSISIHFFRSLCLFFHTYFFFELFFSSWFCFSIHGMLFFSNDIFHFKRAMKWFSFILAKQHNNIKWRAQMDRKREIVFRVCVWDKRVMKRRPLSYTSYHMKLASTKNTHKL